ncbi:MAG: hypothetical protein HQK83_11775 [Fibrobacteria bacterium]|nr:hypothetical protein [Fibrobacteria bacterium]
MKCNRCKTLQFHRTPPENVIDAKDCFVRHLPGSGTHSTKNGCILEFNQNGALDIETDLKPAA